MTALGYGMSDGLAVLSFGKYNGRSIAEVPNSYLNWLSEQDWFEKRHPNLQIAVNAELEFREQMQVDVD